MSMFGYARHRVGHATPLTGFRIHYDMLSLYILCIPDATGGSPYIWGYELFIASRPTDLFRVTRLHNIHTVHLVAFIFLMGIPSKQRGLDRQLLGPPKQLII